VWSNEKDLARRRAAIDSTLELRERAPAPLRRIVTDAVELTTLPNSLRILPDTAVT
jgi:hypothetical protein